MLANSSKMTVFDLMDGVFKRSVVQAYRALNNLRLNSEPMLMINAIMLKTARNAWGFSPSRATTTRSKTRSASKAIPLRSSRNTSPS